MRGVSSRNVRWCAVVKVLNMMVMQDVKLHTLLMMIVITKV